MARLRLQVPAAGTERYEITRQVVGESRFVEITKEEFHRLREASERLADMLAIEEKLDLVLANYAEYERELLLLAVEQMVWPGGSWPALRAALFAVNRRILNFLSSARLYLDQVKHEISSMYGKDSTVWTGIRAREVAEYESSLAYRVIDALRNHAQHRSMPVGKLSFPIRREEGDGPERLRFMVVPFLDLSQLRRDSSIKKTVLDEIETTGRTNLNELIRSYLESIGRIHEEVRRLTDSDVAEWEALFESAQTRGRAVFEDLISLAVVIRQDDGTVSESAHLLENVFIGRRALREKNGALVNFTQRYVTNVLTV